MLLKDYGACISFMASFITPLQDTDGFYSLQFCVCLKKNKHFSDLDLGALQFCAIFQIRRMPEIKEIRIFYTFSAGIYDP